MKTFLSQIGVDEKEWYLVDVKNKVLGRVATKIANILRGKDKPVFAPNVDNGGFVVVINADKVKLTGKKLTQKYYYKHSGYMGGLKSIRLDEMLKKHPEKVIRYAVRGMLPNNRLSARLIRKLKIYSGNTHPHKAQSPKLIDI